ncbi:hypothetical protein SHIRM173S_10232 [Streptomyces hirsutus]
MSSSRRSPSRAGGAPRARRARQWCAAGVGAPATAVVVGAPTDVVPNPLFGRPIPVRWWNRPALALTSVLAGIVLSTDVRRPDVPLRTRRPSRTPRPLSGSTREDARRAGPGPHRVPPSVCVLVRQRLRRAASVSSRSAARGRL